MVAETGADMRKPYLSCGFTAMRMGGYRVDRSRTPYRIDAAIRGAAAECPPMLSLWLSRS
jgi:hypothetical protein